MRRSFKVTPKHIITAATASRVRVPKPFDRYFELCAASDDDDFQFGEEIDGYDAKFLAYLQPKAEYSNIDIYPILVDDPDYPVCDLVGGRLYPIDMNDIIDEEEDDQ